MDNLNDSSSPQAGKYKFMGWTCEQEKTDCPKPWADFQIMVHSNEIGEAFGGKDMAKILKASGFEIILRKVKHG